MIKIPSKFIQEEYPKNSTLKEVYINIEHMEVFEIYKHMEEDKDDGSFTAVYRISMIMTNNYYIPLTTNFTEQLFQEFILWANKALAFANIKEKKWEI